MKRIILSFILTLYALLCNGQGKAYNWLLGYNLYLDSFTTSTKAILHFDSLNATLTPSNFKMGFTGAQATISDEGGNLLISTNGCWIANSNMDTIMNGSGLNPGSFANSHCKSFSGIPFPHSDVILPFPDDSNKFILFHQTSNDNLSYRSSELYYTLIDMLNDGGLGGVDSIQKNNIIFQDTLSLGLAVCKHANGRDWWIVALKDSSDLIFKILLTPTGISSITTQHLNVPLAYYNVTQTTFSPDGNKFAYSWAIDTQQNNNWYHDVRLFDFDRCTGMFSNPRLINVSDSLAGLGLAFSSNSKYLYATSIWRVFQINTDSSLIYVDTVALWDGYASPPPFYTHFWTMYLAPNGKIHISTDYSTLDLHIINYPDNADTLCDVQQHALHLPCYQSRANVNHPNYYLGRIVGSPCDTIQWQGIEEMLHNFHYSIFPNPNNGNFRISYLLPQNEKGKFELYNAIGQLVYKQDLPQWSTLQNISLQNLSEGIYNATIISNGKRVSKTIAIMNE